MSTVLTFAIVATTMGFVVWPYFQKKAVFRQQFSDPERNGLLDLIEQRDRLLTTLQEIEFDHETGKLSDGDYAEMRARYRSRAVRLLKEIDRLRARTGGLRQRDRQQPVSKTDSGTETGCCPACGFPTAPGDRFCRHCGRQVASN
jgi:hypothetical protein